MENLEDLPGKIMKTSGTRKPRKAVLRIWETYIA